MENPKIFITRKIDKNPFYMAPVEIIIPFYGEHDRVAKLVESIFKTVHTNRYLISLVDDGSKNQSFIKQLDKKKIPGVRCFQQAKQEGFGAAVNLVLRNPFKVKSKAEIPWIVVMHSDVLVEDNKWLSEMGNTMLRFRDKNVGMVSSMTNNPVAPVSELAGKKSERNEDKVLETGFLPMYCVLAARSMFKQVGDLHEYPYAGNETEEYALRMGKMGFKQAVCGTSWVNHHGSATLSQLAKDRKAQEILRKAKEDFEQNFKNAPTSGT